MSTRVEVVFPYQAADENQLTLHPGDKIEVIKHNPSGWSIGRDCRGNVGAFLISYTKQFKERPVFQLTKEQKTALLTENADMSSSITPSGGAPRRASVQTTFAAATSMDIPVVTDALNGSTRAGGLDDSKILRRASSSLTGGVFRDMSYSDQKQLKALLGFDDDDSDNEAEAPSPHERSRSALGSASSCAVAPSRRGSARAEEAQLIETVIRLRKDIQSADRELALLCGKEEELRSRRVGDGIERSKLKEEVELLQRTVHMRGMVAADLEDRIEVLRCALEGLPLPQYRSLAAKLVEEEEHKRREEKRHSSAPGSPRNDTVSNNAQMELARSLDPIDEPTEEEYEKDPRARKIVKKLQKRIEETLQTKDDYMKQEKKLLKRIKKYSEVIDTMRREIDMIGVELKVTGEQECPSTAEDLTDDDYASSQGSSRHPRERRKAEQRQQKALFDALNIEERDAVDRYQLAEIRYREKSAKVKASQALESAEVSAQREHVEKLKMRLEKGDVAAEKLSSEIALLKRQIQEIEGPAEVAQLQFVKAEEELVIQKAKTAQVLKDRDALLKKLSSDRESMTQKITKEKKRCANFEEELQRLQVLAAQQ
jgi:chromosome segregation ATPase